MIDEPLIARDNVQGPHTWDEFVELDEDDLRELIDGEFIEVEVPGERHEWIVAMLVRRLMAWALKTRGGAVYASGYKVRITNKRGVMPDVQFYRRGNEAMKEFEGRNSEGMVEGRPDLAVEIVSPSSTKYDRVTKLNWYAKIGVPEYRVIDPESRTLVRHILSDGKYMTTDALEGGESSTPDTFPGLTIDLGELWKGPNLGDARA